jgi:hypothetical protein
LREDGLLKPERRERMGKEAKTQAKSMFKEYALPVIKAEGGKYVSKQIGNMIAKRV